MARAETGEIQGKLAPDERDLEGAVNAGAFYLANPGSTGRVVPAVTEFRITDEQGNELPLGERGELCIKSPANILGYWNKPEATAEAFIDGWFHTGDLGVIHPDGYLEIRDRLKDVTVDQVTAPVLEKPGLEVEVLEGYSIEIQESTMLGGRHVEERGGDVVETGSDRL